MIERWSTQIAERVKLSPLVGAWYSELGGLNRWCHIWAYIRMPPKTLRGPRTCPQRRRLATTRRPARRYPEAGEHAGRPGVLLAAALAVEPAVGFRDPQWAPVPSGFARLSDWQAVPVRFEPAGHVTDRPSGSAGPTPRNLDRRSLRSSSFPLRLMRSLLSPGYKPLEVSTMASSRVLLNRPTAGLLSADQPAGTGTHSEMEWVRTEQPAEYYRIAAARALPRAGRHHAMGQAAPSRADRLL
jgi:NIPSNAP